MNKTIVIKIEENYTAKSIENIFKEKVDIWLDEEYSNGWIIKILKFDFYIKGNNTNHYYNIIYKAKQDPLHLELLERIKIGV